MAINVTTPPTVEPVTLDEVKLHCRVDVNDDDTLLDSLIAVARQYCEVFTGRVFITQTIQYDLQRWPSGKAIHLPRPPLQSVTSVTWWDTEGNDTVLTAGTDYLVDTSPTFGTVLLPYSGRWPSEILYPVHPIRIEYLAGYGDNAADVPEYIKAAIKLLVGNWYENREQVLPAGHVGKELPMGAQSLLWQERTFWTEEMNR